MVALEPGGPLLESTQRNAPVGTKVFDAGTPNTLYHDNLLCISLWLLFIVKSYCCVGHRTKCSYDVFTRPAK